MAYKVRVKETTGRSPLKRDYGTGAEGQGKAYRTKDGAEKRAKKLRREFPPKKGFMVEVVRTRDNVFAGL